MRSIITPQVFKYALLLHRESASPVPPHPSTAPPPHPQTLVPSFPVPYPEALVEYPLTKQTSYLYPLAIPPLPPPLSVILTPSTRVHLLRAIR